MIQVTSQYKTKVIITKSKVTLLIRDFYNKSKIESIINRIFILAMMLKRYRDIEKEVLIRQVNKRGRYVRPLIELNHPNHLGSKDSSFAESNLD